jgi:hypothetical protein
MDEQNRPFTEVIAEYGNGRLLERLSAELAEVARAVGETNLKGTVTLKLSVEPSGEGAYTLNADVTAKVPKRGVGQAIFYADQSGNLSRRDPRQPELPLRTVGGTAINA